MPFGRTGVAECNTCPTQRFALVPPPHFAGPHSTVSVCGPCGWVVLQTVRGRKLGCPFNDLVAQPGTSSVIVHVLYKSKTWAMAILGDVPYLTRRLIARHPQRHAASRIEDQTTMAVCSGMREVIVAGAVNCIQATSACLVI